MTGNHDHGRKKGTGFSLDLLDMGGFVPPPPLMGGQVQGSKILMGGLMRGIDVMAENLTLIDYVIN